jgi:hypothetical protein
MKVAEQFGLFKLPVCLLVLSALLEVVTYPLGTILPNRNAIDILAAAAERDAGPARVVVFGDSVATFALKDYTLGPRELVVSMTSNAASGLPAQFLLLKRYLAHHAPPEHVILSMVPDFASFAPDTQAAKNNLTTVFRHREEQDWLAQIYPGLVTPTWQPVALDIDRIVGPITGLIVRNPAKFPRGAQLADSSTAKPEPLIRTSAAFIKAADLRSRRKQNLHHINRLALEQLCDLAHSKDVKVHLLYSPTPEMVRQSFISNPDFAGMRNEVRLVLDKRCVNWQQFDMNDTMPSANFLDDALHLSGAGWEQTFAGVLRTYIQRL